MISKISLCNKKTLKLINVLKFTIENVEDLDVTFAQMQSYMKTKGVSQIGPLIQYTRAYISDIDELNIEIELMVQCSKNIHSVEEPYYMESSLRVPNCMYCRYIGPEDKLHFAYQKIQIEAFENDIPLKGDSYTIFVDEDEENEIIIADVFMERID